MKQRQLLPIVTVTVVALATLGQKARRGARISSNIAMRREKVLIPHNGKQSVAAGKAAKVTRLLLSAKRYGTLSRHGAMPCFNGVRRRRSCNQRDARSESAVDHRSFVATGL